MKLDESIKRMELREQLIGIAMLKEGEYEDYFTELEMYRGLQRIKDEIEYYRTIFTPICDGSPEHSDIFNNFMCWAYGCGDFEFGWMGRMRITKDSRAFFDGEFKEEYGSDIFDKLRPVAERVWELGKEQV